MLVLRADRDGHERAQLEALGAHAARTQPAAQAARDDGQHDVVDRAAERVLDELEVLEVVAHERQPPVRADRHVQRRRPARGSGRPRRPRRCPRAPRGRCSSDSAGRVAADSARPASSNGSCASPRIPRAASCSALGSDAAIHGSPSCGAAGGGTGVASNSTVIRSTPEMPSTSAWWDLEISAKRPLLEPLHEPRLPQRLRAVEPLRVDPRGQRAQLLLGARLRQRRVAHVVARG